MTRTKWECPEGLYGELVQGRLVTPDCDYATAPKRVNRLIINLDVESVEHNLLELYDSL